GVAQLRAGPRPPPRGAALPHVEYPRLGAGVTAEFTVGVDIGGTFTDCVAVDGEGRVTLGKALSTPDDFSVGAINAVRDAAEQLHLADEQELLGATRLFFHACTVGDNTLLTRSGPRTALLTTAG